MQPENPFRLQLPEGIEFNTILADPPWPLDKPNTMFKRHKIHYDRMSLDEIKSIKVPLIASPDCHLWLWTTNPHLEIALEVVKAWGFTFRTMATWPKSKIGTGWWLRSQTEHLILAAKSDKFRHNPGNFTTILKGNWRGHSMKPKSSYTMIEALSPGPRLELFAREERKGWYQLSSPNEPAEAFGQLHKKASTQTPPPENGVVRGVGGLEIVPGEKYHFRQRVEKLTPCTAIYQKGRSVRIEINGEKKSVSIDNIRPLEA